MPVWNEYLHRVYNLYCHCIQSFHPLQEIHTVNHTIFIRINITSMVTKKHISGKKTLFLRYLTYFTVLTQENVLGGLFCVLFVKKNRVLFVKTNRVLFVKKVGFAIVPRNREEYKFITTKQN